MKWDQVGQVGHGISTALPYMYNLLQVEFAPTLKQLASIVGGIGSHLTNSISEIQRLPTILTKKKSTKDVSTFIMTQRLTSWNINGPVPYIPLLRDVLLPLVLFFSADPVDGCLALSCVQDISRTSQWIRTKFAWDMTLGHDEDL